MRNFLDVGPKCIFLPIQIVSCVSVTFKQVALKLVQMAVFKSFFKENMESQIYSVAISNNMF